jgi:hypothetical protein
MDGKTLEGWWFDRTQEYLARRRGEDFGRFQYATRETLELDPLPCWKHLTPEQRQKRVAALVSEIEAEAAARRERTGIPPLGPQAILTQNPQSQPAKTKRSPAPAERLLRVRRRLSERRRETASGTTRRAFSHGLLPAAVAVRERISDWSTSWPEDS